MHPLWLSDSVAGVPFPPLRVRRGLPVGISGDPDTRPLRIHTDFQAIGSAAPTLLPCLRFAFPLILRAPPQTPPAPDLSEKRRSGYTTTGEDRTWLPRPSWVARPLLLLLPRVRRPWRLVGPTYLKQSGVTALHLLVEPASTMTRQRPAEERFNTSTLRAAASHGSLAELLIHSGAQISASYAQKQKCQTFRKDLACEAGNTPLAGSLPLLVC